MTIHIPQAPREGDSGSKIWFGVHKVGSVLAAAIFRVFQVGTTDTVDAGDLGVYPTSGKHLTLGYTTPDTTAHQISAADHPCQGVLIWADPTNTVPVYIGAGSSVTADYGTATSGVPVKPDSATPIACRNTQELYARSSVTGQKITLQLSSDV